MKESGQVLSGAVFCIDSLLRFDLKVKESGQVFPRAVFIDSLWFFYWQEKESGQVQFCIDFLLKFY